MEVESYTFDSSNREDLSDVIYNIDPTETPFVSGCERGVATNKKHEWQIDELVTEGMNANAEGADYTASYDTRPEPDRLFNYTQISAKNLSVTGTQEAIEHAGRKSELAYQMAKMGLEIRRDIEYQMLSGLSGAEADSLTGANAVDGAGAPIFAGTSGAGGNARVAGSISTWIFTNQSVGTGGTPQSVTSNQPAAGDVYEVGTARAFLESHLKEVIRKCYIEGGNPSHVFVDPFNKQAVSAMTGGTTRFDQSEDRRLVTAVDVYVSDFGEHMIIPDRFLKQNGTDGSDGVSAYVMDMTKWGIHYLRPFMQENLARIGDAVNRLLIAEWTLCSKNQASSGMVRDLTDQ